MKMQKHKFYFIYYYHDLLVFKENEPQKELIFVTEVTPEKFHFYNISNNKHYSKMSYEVWKYKFEEIS